MKDMWKRIRTTAATAAVVIVCIMTTCSYAAQSGNITVTAAETKTDQPVKGVALSLFSVAKEDPSSDCGYRLSDFAKNAGITEENLAGSAEQETIAENLRNYCEKNAVSAKDTKITDDLGKVEFSGLENGIYLVKNTTTKEQEKSVGIRYQMNAFLVAVIKENSKVSCYPKGVVIKAEEEKPSGSVVLVKTDEESGTYLPGAVFGLYDENGKKLGTYTTDENGQIRAKDLDCGDYYFQEESAPDGYIRKTDKLAFRIDKEDSLDSTVSLKATNRKEKAAVEKEGAAGGGKQTDSTIGGQIFTNDSSHLFLLVVGAGAALCLCGFIAKKKSRL